MEIIDTYTDTDGEKHIYFKGGLANGPISASFLMLVMNKFTKINCMVCGLDYKDDNFYRLTNGVPGYWEGGHPERPQDAEGFYCSCECVHAKEKE